MKNLASGKLPIENNSGKSVWIRPEIATNGNITDYDGKNGFSWSFWPATYTIDLKELTQIKSINFLLWDGLGNNSDVKDKRKYDFGLAVSEDNNVWFEVYNNLGNGDNGWFNFSFQNELKVRYVRLNCIRNSTHSEFHIVEFQIFDEEVKVKSRNSHDIPIFGLFGISNIINENLNNFDGRIEELSNKLKDKIAEAESINKQKENEFESQKKVFVSYNEEFKKAVNSAKIGVHAKEYAELAKKNEEAAIPWLIGAGVVTLFLIIFSFFSIYGDDRIHEIADQYVEHENSFAFFHLTISIFSKILLFVGSIYILRICVNNYRAYLHNQKINEHKAATYKIILELREGNSEIKDKVELEKLLISSINIIFTHQKTGFSTNDKNDSSILLSQIMDLIKSSKP